MEEYTSPVFYLKKKVIFPYCTMKVEVTESKLSENLKEGEKIVTYPVRGIFDMAINRGRPATLSEIIRIEKKDNRLQLEVKGLSRVRIDKISRLREAAFTLIEEKEVDISLPLWEELRKKAQELIFLINVEESDKLITLLNYIINMNQMTDFVANYFVMDFPRRYRLFTELDATRRGTSLLEILTGLITKMNDKRSSDPK